MRATSREPVRGFRLVIEPTGSDEFGVRLEQTNGGGTPPKVLASIRPREVASVMDPLHEALRVSRYQRTVLSPSRRKPIMLEEAAGVRLALALVAVEPISKWRRREEILGGVAAMSAEEAYYWFARTTGPIASRARRALRIMLSDDGRSGIEA
jgi:hypothetical protein